MKFHKKFIENKNTLTVLIIIASFLFAVSSLFSQHETYDALLIPRMPDKFKARFETTKGSFEVTAEKKFSPLAVERFYQLINKGYFKNIPIYRVMKNFVAQFGTVDGKLDSAWSKHIILDEPVLKSNDTGTIAFARAGKKTRGTQLFINLKNNSRLDTVSYGETLGFPAFAYISSGMDVVYKFYDGYGDEPRLKLDSIPNATEFLKKNYPELDYIIKAYIIKE
ncbi:MAG: peptidylprolyl isomerase [Ignavibacteria bacterium]|nr:peptidylprolyl isomerase [Ignavibacteria bacterium]